MTGQSTQSEQQCKKLPSMLRSTSSLLKSVAQSQQASASLEASRSPATSAKQRGQTAASHQSRNNGLSHSRHKRPRSTSLKLSHHKKKNHHSSSSHASKLLSASFLQAALKRSNNDPLLKYHMHSSNLPPEHLNNSSSLNRSLSASQHEERILSIDPEMELSIDRLKSLEKGLAYQLQQALVQIETIKGRLARKDDEIHKIHRRCEERDLEYIRYREKVHLKLESVEALENDLEQKRDLIEELRLENRKLRRQLDERDRDKDELLKEKDRELKRLRRDFENQLEEKDAIILDKEKIIDHHRKDNDSIAQNRDKFLSEIRELQRKVQLMEEENASMQRNLIRAEDKYEDIHSKYMLADRQFSIILEENRQLDEDKDELKTLIEQYRKDNEELQQSLEDMLMSNLEDLGTNTTPANTNTQQGALSPSTASVTSSAQSLLKRMHSQKTMENFGSIHSGLGSPDGRSTNEAATPADKNDSHHNSSLSDSLKTDSKQSSVYTNDKAHTFPSSEEQNAVPAEKQNKLPTQPQRSASGSSAVTTQSNIPLSSYSAELSPVSGVESVSHASEATFKSPASTIVQNSFHNSESSQNYAPSATPENPYTSEILPDSLHSSSSFSSPSNSLVQEQQQQNANTAQRSESNSQLESGGDSPEITREKSTLSIDTNPKRNLSQSAEFKRQASGSNYQIKAPPRSSPLVMHGGTFGDSTDADTVDTHSENASNEVNDTCSDSNVVDSSSAANSNTELGHASQQPSLEGANDESVSQPRKTVEGTHTEKNDSHNDSSSSVLHQSLSDTVPEKTTRSEDDSVQISHSSVAHSQSPLLSHDTNTEEEKSGEHESLSVGDDDGESSMVKTEQDQNGASAGKKDVQNTDPKPILSPVPPSESSSNVVPPLNTNFGSKHSNPTLLNDPVAEIRLTTQSPSPQSSIGYSSTQKSNNLSLHKHSEDNVDLKMQSRSRSSSLDTPYSHQANKRKYGSSGGKLSMVNDTSVARKETDTSPRMGNTSKDGALDAGIMESDFALSDDAAFMSNADSESGDGRRLSDGSISSQRSLIKQVPRKSSAPASILKQVPVNSEGESKQSRATSAPGGKRPKSHAYQSSKRLTDVISSQVEDDSSALGPDQNHHGDQDLNGPESDSRSEDVQQDVPQNQVSSPTNDISSEGSQNLPLKNATALLGDDTASGPGKVDTVPESEEHGEDTKSVKELESKVSTEGENLPSVSNPKPNLSINTSPEKNGQKKQTPNLRVLVHPKMITNSPVDDSNTAVSAVLSSPGINTEFSSAHFSAEDHMPARSENDTESSTRPSSSAALSDSTLTRFGFKKVDSVLDSEGDGMSPVDSMRKVDSLLDADSLFHDNAASNYDHIISPENFYHDGMGTSADIAAKFGTHHGTYIDIMNESTTVSRLNTDSLSPNTHQSIQTAIGMPIFSLLDDGRKKIVWKFKIEFDDETAEQQAAGKDLFVGVVDPLIGLNTDSEDLCARGYGMYLSDGSIHHGSDHQLYSSSLNFCSGDEIAMVLDVDRNKRRVALSFEHSGRNLGTAWKDITEEKAHDACFSPAVSFMSNCTAHVTFVS